MIEGYLQRIGYSGSRQPTLETLRQIHRAHLLAVPFENFDILLDVPIHLSVPALFDKIVRRRRGGFCYELNGLFAALLEQLDFKVARLSARVHHQADGQLGPEFDHMLLLVELPEPWIADVGFGDSFLEPLRLKPRFEDLQHRVAYRLQCQAQVWTLERRRPDSDWERQYVFTLAPRQLEDFEAMCTYQQTSTESVFTRKVVCSRATPDGRITWTQGRLVMTSGPHREERPVTDGREVRQLLESRFGIDLGASARLDRLLRTASPIDPNREPI